MILLDNVAFTGAEQAYTIPQYVSSIAIGPRANTMTLSVASGGDYLTIPAQTFRSFTGQFGGVLYFTGVLGDTAEIQMLTGPSY
jgi:hypothetical protein